MDTFINLSEATLRISTPLILVGMAGLLSYQVGLINIALEGLMLAGAFTAVVAGFEIGSTWGGVLFAALVGALLGMAFAIAVISMRANLIVAGLAFNFLAIGGTAFLLDVLYDTSGTFAPLELEKLPVVNFPLLEHWLLIAEFVLGYSILGDIPVIGAITAAIGRAMPILGDIVLGHSPLVYVSWLMVPLTSIFLYRSVVGGHIRAVGEHPEAARTAGISVTRMQYLSLMLGGALCGLAGAHLSVGDLALFRERMTGDRGFIALAAVYFAAARPRLTAVACLLFGFFQALQFRMQTRRSIIPNEFFQLMPYLMVVVALVVISFRQEWRKGWS